MILEPEAVATDARESRIVSMDAIDVADRLLVSRALPWMDAD